MFGYHEGTSLASSLLDDNTGIHPAEAGPVGFCRVPCAACYMHGSGDVIVASMKFISGITLVTTLQGRTHRIRTLNNSTGFEFTTTSRYHSYSMVEFGILVPPALYVSLEATDASGPTG